MDYRTKMEMVRRAREGAEGGYEPEGRRRRDSRGRYVRSAYDGPEMYDDGYEATGRRREDYEPDMRYPHYPQGRSMSRIGFAQPQAESLSWEMAQEWVRGLRSKTQRGEKWSYEHIKKLMEQHKIQLDPVEFWAVINALYCDYGEVLKKYGVNSLDAYLDLAKAWLQDEDAVPDKAMVYFVEIVK